MPAKPAPETARNVPAWSISPQAFESLLQANAKAAEIWLESWARLAGESASFASRRWKQDLDLLERLRGCKTPLELLQVQSAFVQKALVDYMRETGKIADLETEAGVSEIEVLDTGARKACGSAERPAGK